ncbi:MAG: Sterol desaturase [Deltaproteobacteria bacterium]|nr:Sterol desaturase [Deltaproteobacteria bacterium]
MLAQIGHATLQLVALGVVLGAIEWCYPNRAEQGRLRPQLATDLAFYFGQHVIWLGVELAGLVAVGSVLAMIVPASCGAWFASQPWPVQACELVVVGDVLVYWYHRASHDVPWLWTFHRVHHSSLSLDWLAAHREHPVDGLLTQIAMNLPALVFGVSLEGLAWLIVFRGVWAAFIHSNVRLPLGPLRYLVGSPELHHWHHANVPRTLHNFSNLAPWTDVVFGTYHCPLHQHHDLGLPGHPVKSYVGWLVAPHRDPTGVVSLDRFEARNVEHA